MQTMHMQQKLRFHKATEVKPLGNERHQVVNVQDVEQLQTEKLTRIRLHNETDYSIDTIFRTINVPNAIENIKLRFVVST